MKLIAIVGTNTNFDSTNRKLIKYISKHFSSQADIEVCEIKEIPMYCADDEMPQTVNTLTTKIKAADGVIISTPEYDHSITAALKSTIDWLSESCCLAEKPVMIVGSSHGSLGTLRAQLHLREILQAPRIAAYVMTGKEFLLGNGKSAFWESEDLLQEDKVVELENYFSDFIQFATRFNGGASK
ncbi:NADPH-dependent FMN reductase [Marinilactibacillus kalidii]|uniref:NADPH-dependent FMN reductase n=1 Tax=Marinilactibacillus kalidii TaxID=2820274 RepID=UPI001ABE2D62|nr:NADPH-dependent FMN reductase [Marinilactibacillus kalidii]